MTRITTAKPADDRQQDERFPLRQWYGWGSPVGLGAGLVSVGGFFALLSIGLNTLASTSY